jgi:hypothetical protein
MRGLLASFILTMAINLLPAKAMSSGELQVPEFVITKPAKEYCAFVINLSPASSRVAERRLFEFMEAANSYTKGWRVNFAVVGVNYVTNDKFGLLSFHDCQESETALDFVTQFIEGWQKRHCSGECQLTKPHIEPRANLDFVIPSGDYGFKSQIDEFLHYRQRDDLSRCTLEIELAPVIATDFAHTELFGAVMELQRKFRYPILDISQIDRKLYILLSRQCMDKESLYTSMLRNLKRQGASVDGLNSVNFHPNVSDYLFSQTGQK